MTQKEQEVAVDAFDKKTGDLTTITLPGGIELAAYDFCRLCKHLQPTPFGCSVFDLSNQLEVARKGVCYDSGLAEGDFQGRFRWVNQMGFDLVQNAGPSNPIPNAFSRTTKDIS